MRACVRARAPACARGVLPVKGGPLQLIRMHVSRTSRYREHVHLGKGRKDKCLRPFSYM